MELTRRELLKWLGATGIAVTAASYIPWLGKSASAEQATTSGTQTTRLRRWSMVIDLKRCDGCIGLKTSPQCTQACIMGHQAPVGMKWIEVFEFKRELGGSYFMPVPCQHCENAPCTNVCPVGATFSTPEGVVLVDQTRCIGCRLCMAACPYQRRFFNWGDPQVPPETRSAKYDLHRQVPAIKGTVMKCSFCVDMARNGSVPFCVAGCPRSALWFGDLEEDIATNSRDIVKLSRFMAENEAFRFKEELGTHPRVYYLPGHGQNVGRNPYQTGLLPASWPWGGKK